MRKGRIFLKLLMICFIFMPVFSVFSQGEEEVYEYSDGDYADEEYISQEEKNIDDDRFKGERISLDLKGVDIAELFKMLSIKSGKTIVPTRSVSGRVTIFLNNITFQDALDIILVSHGLAVDKRGDIIFIMTENEYKNTYGRDYGEKRKMRMFRLKYANPDNIFSALAGVKSDLGKIIMDKATGTAIVLDLEDNLGRIAETIKELDRPLKTAVFDLNYAKTEDIGSKLSEIKSPDAGEVVVDERSSKVFVSDLPDKLEEIKQIVKAFDEETKQVFIQAEILEVTLDDRFRRGIDWQKLFASHNFHGLDFKGEFPVANLDSYQQISVGELTSDGYNMVMQFLQDNTDTKILSRPMISVVNNEEARILVGSKEAYVTQTQSQAETSTVTAEAVEFIDVGIKMNVVPKINKDGFITMKIKPEVSSVRTTLTTSLDSEIPIVDTAEAETVVKVKDGTTIMLGGLIKEEDRDTVSGIAGLMDLPIIGGFFGNHDRRRRRTETVIFITPRLSSGEAVLAGTEPEKFIPKSVMPQQVRDNIILRELEKIQVEKDLHPAEELYDETMLGSAPQNKEDYVIIEEDFKKKAKGFKELEKDEKL